jgi:uncharacterized protein
VRWLSEQLRRRLREAVGANEPTDRLAAAWAVGVAVGMSPFIGLHTLLALTIAVVFRLNKIDVLLGTLLINPWTLPPYFAAVTLLGSRLTRIDVHAIGLPRPSELLTLEMWGGQQTWLAPLLTAWTVGSFIGAGIGGLVTFLVVRRLVRRRRLRNPVS